MGCPFGAVRAMVYVAFAAFARWGRKVRPMTTKTVHIYIDGAVFGNAKVPAERTAGAAAILMLVNGQGQRDKRPAACKELTHTLPRLTSTQATLEALKLALGSLKEYGLTLVINTANTSVSGTLSRHWTPAQNKVLITEIKTLLAKHSVTWTHAHAAESVYAQRANDLACEAANQ